MKDYIDGWVTPSTFFCILMNGDVYNHAILFYQEFKHLNSTTITTHLNYTQERKQASWKDRFHVSKIMLSALCLFNEIKKVFLFQAI